MVISHCTYVLGICIYLESPGYHGVSRYFVDDNASQSEIMSWYIIKGYTCIHIVLSLASFNVGDLSQKILFKI